MVMVMVMMMMMVMMIMMMMMMVVMVLVRGLEDGTDGARIARRAGGIWWCMVAGGRHRIDMGRQKNQAGSGRDREGSIELAASDSIGQHWTASGSIDSSAWLASGFGHSWHWATEIGWHRAASRGIGWNRVS